MLKAACTSFFLEIGSNEIGSLINDVYTNIIMHKVSVGVCGANYVVSFRISQNC